MEPSVTANFDYNTYPNAPIADPNNSPMGCLIYLKIPLIMKEVEAIPKNKQGHGYKFRGVDDVYQALQNIMAKHQVFTVPRVLSDRKEERQSSKGSTLIYRVLTIAYDFYSSDGSRFTSVVIGEGMDSGDKASNKAMSVAHKYALLQVFCIPTEEAKDPEEESHEVKPKIQKHPESVRGAEIYEAQAEQKKLLMDVCKMNGVRLIEDQIKVHEFFMAAQPPVKMIDIEKEIKNLKAAGIIGGN